MEWGSFSSQNYISEPQCLIIYEKKLIIPHSKFWLKCNKSF